MKLLPPFALVLLTIIVPSLASATDLTYQKLMGRWKKTPTDYRLSYAIDGSQAVACSAKWILVGAPYASEQATRQGAAQVFNAATGAWVRELLPPGPPTGLTYFGQACTITGDKGLVCTGDFKVHVFNLSSGALLKTIAPTTSAVGTFFGTSIAVSGSRLIVGAPGTTGPGSCYVFDLNTGAELARLYPTDSLASNGFGRSVSAEGDLLVIGAPGAMAAYLFDLGTFTQLRKIQQVGSIEGFGLSVALSNGKLAIGAPGGGYLNPNSDGQVWIVDLFTGAAGNWVYDAQSLQHFGLAVAGHQGRFIYGGQNIISPGMVNIISPTGTLTSGAFDEAAQGPHKGFGMGVAICGNTAVVAAPFDDTQAATSGAVYVIRGTDLPIVCGKVIGKGDTAAGGSEISYATFGDVFMSANNEIGFTSTLSGPGSNGGKDQGAWSQVNSSGIGLVMKSRDVLGTATIASVNKLLLNRSDTMIVHAMLTGLGVTTFDNQAIYRDNGSVSTLVFRTGTAMPALGGGQPLAFTQVIQNNASNRLAAACTLRPILGKTSATNDSGILWHDIGTLTTESVREGSTAGGTGFTYGQFSGRVAGTHAQLTYAAATNIGQAVFQKGFGSAEQVVAQTGAATQALGFAFSSFIGETSDENDIALMRVGLRSTSAPIVNSEGLWTGTVFSSPTRVMMKGDLIPGSSSVRIAKFINYWLINGNTMALVQLSGTGVTSANDQALLLSYAPPAVGPARVVTLMREGDLAPGCDTATIGVISRVEVDNVHGRYLVLATLAGAPAGTELALFRGHASYPMSANAEEALRRPVLSLRKGQLYSNQPGKLKSMSLPTSNVTASGAGGTGIGCAINTAGTPSDQPFATLVVEFDNGVRQIMEGKL